jgi:hypothetical protein
MDVMGTERDMQRSRLPCQPNRLHVHAILVCTNEQGLCEEDMLDLGLQLTIGNSSVLP